ncbi:hypothetical protein C8A01DRAFT_14263 [Parachaetomium inaequale]|uniref:DUF4187 domain-containing protein n=1 Tax=Parachaetomium inaequale TaxID=2588326 RepID=A0AAN6PL95_9PEZI|nr:hypothetical protein C8A01DRAFT_14263 [Parachaetomium inaequale]
MNPLKPPPPNGPHSKDEESSSSEEEDYMTMTFSDSPSTHPSSSSTTNPQKNPTHANKNETSLQRRLRLRREAEARARPKSKAELAAEADARREAALSQSLFTAQPKSKGLAMMARMGFTGGALGKQQPPPQQEENPQGRGGGGEGGEGGLGEGKKESGSGGGGGARTEPIRIEMRDGRSGIGLESERKRKLREAAEAAGERAKRAKADEGEYRERMRREREEARWERQFVAGQKVAERMAGERDEAAGEHDGKGVVSRPLSGIPVVWRGLVKAREEAERDRRMRYDLEQGLARLPTYEDDEEDEDDKQALGKATTTYVTAEDLDEEDPELEEFSALPADEKLQKVVEHLREEHHYCFWCKFTYPDEKMEGCPGLTEEDHD